MELAWFNVIAGLVVIGVGVLLQKMYPEESDVDRGSWAIRKFEQRLTTSAARSLDPKDFTGKIT